MYILKYMDSLSLIEEMATHNSHSQNAKLNGVYIIYINNDKDNRSVY